MRVPEVGVPSTGVMRACQLGNPTVPVKVGEASRASSAVSERLVAAIDMFAEPLKDTHAMVRAVCRVVAVPALPETEVWSPVFVPEFVPVISEVKATVPAASLRVYIRAAVFVLVNELENVSATFRRSMVALLKVLAPVFV